MNNFADIITKLRKEKGLTQRQVAEVFGVSDKAVSKWERAETMPDVSLLPKIAEFYGISVDELLHGDEVKKKEQNVAIPDRSAEAPFAHKKYIFIYAAADLFLILAFFAWLTIGFFTDNGWKDVGVSFAIVAYVVAIAIAFGFLCVRAKNFADCKTIVEKYAHVTLLHALVASVMFIACSGLFYSLAEYLIAGFVSVGVLTAFLLYTHKENKYVKALERYRTEALIPSVVTAVVCIFVPFTTLTAPNAPFEIRLTVVRAIADFVGLEWSVPFFVLFVSAVAYSAVAVCKELPSWSILAAWTAVGILAVVLTGRAEQNEIQLYAETFSFGTAKTAAGAYLIYGNLIFTLTAFVVYVLQKRKNFRSKD